MTRARWIAAAAAALVLGGAGCGIDSPVSRTLGARCDANAECDDRCLNLPAGSFPGGFCSVSCESDADCPSDARCIDLVGGVCLFDCADTAGCAFLGTGWSCFESTLRQDAMQRAKVCLGG